MAVNNVTGGEMTYAVGPGSVSMKHSLREGPPSLHIWQYRNEAKVTG